jgi:hypothetical protein
MVFTECYSIFIQLIHIVDEVRYRAMWFDAVRYSSIEVQGKEKNFCGKQFLGADKNGKASQPICRNATP